MSTKRMQVFAIREDRGQKAGAGEVGTAAWVKAGSAWSNRDGSFNVYLDVLPLDGRLHVREAIDQAPEGALTGVDRLRALIKSVEFSGVTSPRDGDACCPWCGCLKYAIEGTEKHAEDCSAFTPEGEAK